MKKTSKNIVTIKLHKNDIPYLNAALYLGVILQDWCDMAAQCGLGDIQHGQSLWGKIVRGMRGNIYDQTQIEGHEFGQATTPNITALREVFAHYKKELRNLRH